MPADREFKTRCSRQETNNTDVEGEENSYAVGYNAAGGKGGWMGEELR